MPTRSFDYPVMNLRHVPPRIGNSIGLGHSVSSFPDLYDNAPVSKDGAPAWHAPYSFTRRLRHSGRVILSLKSPPLVGMNFIKKGIHLESKEVRKAQGFDSPILHTRRKMTIYQWFPAKTDLLNEDCNTAFYYDKYDGSINKFDGLPKPSERFLSFSFMPRRRRIRDFAMFFQDAHKIHYDPDYAELEGYPDLVVQTHLQLTIILDTMQAYMPKGLMCNAIEYRVVNPLFCNREIRVFRHWYQDDPPLGLDDLAPDPIKPIDLEESQSALHPTMQESVARPHPKPFTLPRRSGIEARLLFWTEDDNGVVGTVVFATLITEKLASWELDPEMGYILPAGSIWPVDEMRVKLAKQKPMIESLAENLEASIAEPDTFDSLGRPVSYNQPLRAWPSRHPWQQDDDDIAALESERDARRQYARRLEESRNLLGQMLRGGNHDDSE